MKRLKTNALRKTLKYRAAAAHHTYIRLLRHIDSDPRGIRSNALLNQQKQRAAIYRVSDNSEIFTYPDEITKQEIGDLYGRPGIDDDNDTTESLIKK